MESLPRSSLSQIAHPQPRPSAAPRAAKLRASGGPAVWPLQVVKLEGDVKALDRAASRLNLAERRAEKASAKASKAHSELMARFLPAHLPRPLTKKKAIMIMMTEKKAIMIMMTKAMMIIMTMTMTMAMTTAARRAEAHAPRLERVKELLVGIASVDDARAVVRAPPRPCLSPPVPARQRPHV